MSFPEDTKSVLCDEEKAMRWDVKMMADELDDSPDR